MSEIISAGKFLKALKETSELLFIPATIGAVWAELGAFLSGYFRNGILVTFILCSVIGLSSSIGLLQILIAINSRIKATSFFAIASGVFIAAGLISLFQDYSSFKFYQLSPFTGLALVTWGVMLEEVRRRVEEKNV